MRREPNEVKSQGGSGLARLGSRATSAKRSRMRRLTLESLEERTLMATAPISVVSTQKPIDSNGFGSNSNDSSPFVAIDPLDPKKLVTVYTNRNTNGGTFIYAQAATSTDGGVTWQQLFLPQTLPDPTSTTGAHYSESKGMGVGFDRAGDFFVGALQDNGGNSGAVVLNKFDFNGSSPANRQDSIVYQWNQAGKGTNQNLQPAIINFSLAVDSNLRSYTDLQTGVTQSDPTSGSVYIAWTTNTPPPSSPPNPYNPYVIELVASQNGLSWPGYGPSSDPGTLLSGNDLFSAHAGNQRYTAPEVAVSQGKAGTVGGQATVIWDDFGTFAGFAPAFDEIQARTATYNGSSLSLSAVNHVTYTYVRGSAAAPYSRASTVSPIGIGPGAQIAIDNTLGSFNTSLTTGGSTPIPTVGHEGRIYVTYVDHDNPIAYPTNPVSNTDVYLTYSDDGGQTWTNSGVVNDDNANVDGHTASTGPNFSSTTAVFPTGRPQFEPSIAVDPVTGTVALSWLDARDDASGLRYATYLTTSIDGGQTFAKNTFANAPNVVTDGITGKPVVVGPMTENGNGETSLSFGSHQGLAIADGVIHPVWAGTTSFDVSFYNPATGAIINRPLGDSFTGQLLGIETAQATYVYGPRVIAGTMGPNTQNLRYTNPITGQVTTFPSTFAADGTRQVGGFIVTFDRPVDVSTFTAADVTVRYRNTVTPLSSLGTAIALDPTNPIQALDAASYYGGAEATSFYVKFAMPQSGVGTYSYSIGPNISDRARTGSQSVVVDAGTTTFAPTNVPVTISDAPASPALPTPALSTVNVSGYAANQFATNVTVDLQSITHPNDGDLLITLTSPGGVSVVLSNQHGGTGGANYTGTIFDSSVFNPISGGTPPFTGTFSPDQSLTAFNGASGSGLNGQWTLSVTDLVNNAVADTGTIDNWSLTFSTSHYNSAQGVAGGLTMDQNADGVNDTTGTTDVFADPTPLGSIPFQAPYVTTTLPIIVPGPYIVSNFVPGVAKTPDNLVTNATVGFLDVTFDRDMNAASFTPGQILRMMGPTGQITGAFTVQPEYNAPLINGQNYAPGDSAAHIRTFRITFPVLQQVSGTYTIVLGAGIKSANGDAVDTNQNAGVKLLFDTPTGNTTDVTYATPDNPLNASNATITAGQTITSSITVNDVFDIQKLNLALNITYPHDPDLQATLSFTSADPAVGTIIIPLFTNVGNVGSINSQHDFINTLFSDDLTNTPISLGGPPFNGRFNPQAAFSVLNGLQVKGGVFTLTIKNDATSGVNSTGTLNSWSLTLIKNSAVGNSTGLGEPVADQSTVGFRIFTMDPTNPLSSNTWTAVGPASENSGANSGRIGGIALDPSDPSGNTAYVAGASGGIWKTTDFLTNKPGGPTYIALTDSGANYSLNIGSITVFGRNNDPNQSIIIAGTGEGDSLLINNPPAPGVGFLISFNGGSTWTLLDSIRNYDTSGNLIPSSARGHDFLGVSTYKVIVDPKPTPTGDVILYAAMAGFNVAGKNMGGIWRSLDSGRNWQLMRAGVATDVVFDLNSGTINALSNPTGNLRTVYGAFLGDGVYLTPNQGQTWNLMAGGGGDPLLVDPVSAKAVGVNAPADTPNGSKSRIVLAKPALTGNPLLDAQYETWLYAATSDPAGNFIGLFLTKDNGQNWTKARIADQSSSFTNGSPNEVIPTNDITKVDYNLTRGQGTYNIALAVDPNNPSVVYVGGSRDDQPSTLIRVDTTRIADPYSLYVDPTRNGGGTLENTTDPVTIRDPQNVPFYGHYTSTGLFVPDPDPLYNPYLNLVRNPDSPFLANSSFGVSDTLSFANTGSGAFWTPFTQILDGQTDVHRILAIKDPVTGKTRVIVGLDQGIFSGVDTGDGSLIQSVGSEQLPTGSRNGNLQIVQFYNGAAQPGSLAAQVAGALFYGMAQDNGFPQSDPNVLANGNLNWTGTIGDGTNVATDQTGTGVSYFSKWPCCINDQFGVYSTDFFKVRPNDGGAITAGAAGSNTETSRTFGLIQTSSGGAVPDPQWPLAPSFNFAVNPVNGQDVIFGSAAGRLFGTENQGKIWYVLADPSIFDGSVIPALAYGAPDPTGPGVSTSLDNYILVGTAGGHIYVTFTGGGGASGNGTNSNAWTNLSKGLVNNESIIRIVTDPNRSSHDAYAITTNHVYYNPDTSATGSSWVNITGDLFAQKNNPFNDPNLTQNQLSNLGTSSFIGGGLVADWRYVIPIDPTKPNGPTHPLLYVSGQGGVFRSTDNGATWRIFPAMYQSPTDVSLNLTTTPGGNLPNAQISDLDLALGNIDPTTGRAQAVTTVIDPATGQTAIDPATGKPLITTSPNLLLASTYGRGSFGIRLAPIVFNDAVNKVALSTTLPAPLGSDTGKFNNDNITNQTQPIFTGLSEQTAFGNQVALTLMDVTDPLQPFFLGGYDPSKPTTDPSFTNPANETDAFGHFSVQVNAGSYDAINHTTDGLRTVAVFATDAAGTRGNSVNYSFTLITKSPATPAAPVLQTASDTGFNAADNYTSQNRPTFNVLPTVDNSIILLFRKLTTDATYPTIPVNTVSVPIGLPTVLTAIQDPGLVPDGMYTYMTEIEDLAGNISLPSPDSPVITIDTVAPVAPSAPVLQANSDTGTSQTDGITFVKNPTFTVTTGEATPTRTYLLRGAKANGTGATVVSFINGVGSIQDPGPAPDGTYYYFTEQTDLAGNAGPLSATGTMVQILSVIPGPAPTLFLVPSDDSGLKGDDKTNVTQPHLYGIAPVPVAPGYSIDLIQGNTVLATIPDPNNGNFIIQFPAPLADGTYTEFVQVRDVAGNTLASAPLTLTIKTTPPLTSPTLSILPADDSGIPGDGKTNVRRPHLVGVTDPGVVVNILDSAGNILASTTASTFAVNGHPAGYFSVQLASNLSDGTIPLYAVATDIEGNSTPKPVTPSLNLTIYTVQGDFNGDGKADQVTFRYDPAVVPDDQWFIRNSAAMLGQYTASVVDRGWAGHDLPVAGDYNGAGQTLTAVFRPETDTWYIGTPGAPTIIQLGTPGQDVPVPAAYDSSGRTDVATFNPSTQVWNVLLNISDPANPSSRLTAKFGTSATDRPVPGDYLGLGSAQLAVYKSNGEWDARNPSNGQSVFVVNMGGQAGDVPVPGDYDGIGRTEPAIYRPSTGQFIIYNPMTMNVEMRSMVYPAGYSSQPGDLPVPEDYDGDGKIDMAVFRPSIDNYFFDYSSTGQAATSQQGYVGHDVAPQTPLPLIANTIRGANGPGIPQTGPTQGPALAHAFLMAETTVSAATTTSPAPAAVVKPAVVVATAAPAAMTVKASVLPAVVAAPTPTLTLAKPAAKAKAKHQVAAKPKVKIVVSQKTPVVHAAFHQAAAKTSHDAAIVALGRALGGRFFG